MHISSVKINNFKIFKGEHVFDFKGNLIFLVGENNTGKSTFFEAISFLKSGLPKDKQLGDIRNRFVASSEHVVCTIKLVGRVKNTIRDFSETKYESYVFNENDIETILIQRSSEERTIKQNGKDVKLDIKKITIWNPESNQFENISGIDSVISTLFETQFIWADTDPNDVADFGSTKICGRLLNEAIGDFFEGTQWQKFTDVHKETFHGEKDSLSMRTKVIEGKINTILNAQYGNTNVRFNFFLPEASTFFKSGDIKVDDGIETNLEEKGTGMQRAVALAMIQAYAHSLSVHPDDLTKTKPLFFFIDEPEICLHPKAQKQLIDALVAISKIRQIFISTHSPYILKTFDAKNHDLYVFQRKDNDIDIISAARLNLFDWSPSWGEINYSAYQLCTTEFHNELYGCLQEKEEKYLENDIELYFDSKSLKKSKQWIKIIKGIPKPAYSVTLMTYIRNKIHHPENSENADFTDQELKESIEIMIGLLL